MVLGGLTTLFTVKSKLVLAARVPLVKVNVAVTY